MSGLYLNKRLVYQALLYHFEGDNPIAILNTTDGKFNMKFENGEIIITDFIYNSTPKEFDNMIITLTEDGLSSVEKLNGDFVSEHVNIALEIFIESLTSKSLMENPGITIKCASLI